MLVFTLHLSKVEDGGNEIVTDHTCPNCHTVERMRLMLHRQTGSRLKVAIDGPRSFNVVRKTALNHEKQGATYPELFSGKQEVDE